MDWKAVFTVALIVGIGAGMGFWWFRKMSRSKAMDDAREAQLKFLLEQAELDPTGPVRDRLNDHALRRQRWGAIGAGIGIGTAFTSLFILEHFVEGQAGDLIETSTGVLCITAAWLGAAVAQSMGALHWLRRPGPGVRVSALRPHGMTDYLNRRELTVEVGLAAVGWVSVTLAVIAATGSPSWSLLHEPFPAAGLALAGGVLAVACTLVLVLQRRLVSAPLTATDTDELIVAEVVLVLGLRDLYSVTWSMATTATILLVFVPDFSWRVLGTYIMVSVVVLGLGRSNRKRRILAPVARQLNATRQQDVAAS